MPVPLGQYKRVKDRYCIAYYGQHNVFINHLLIARPLIEEAYPGIEVHLACNDGLFDILASEPNTTHQSLLRINRRQYAYIRQIKFNMKTNPVADLLKESDIWVPDEIKIVPGV